VTIRAEPSLREKDRFSKIVRPPRRADRLWTSNVIAAVDLVDMVGTIPKPDTNSRRKRALRVVISLTTASARTGQPPRDVDDAAKKRGVFIYNPAKYLFT
jgi:hypothetical protein